MYSGYKRNSLNFEIFENFSFRSYVIIAIQFVETLKKIVKLFKKL